MKNLKIRKHENNNEQTYEISYTYIVHIRTDIDLEKTALIDDELMGNTTLLNYIEENIDYTYPKPKYHLPSRVFKELESDDIEYEIDDVDFEHTDTYIH